MTSIPPRSRSDDRRDVRVVDVGEAIAEKSPATAFLKLEVGRSTLVRGERHISFARIVRTPRLPKSV